MVISLPKTPYIHRKYMVLADPAKGTGRNGRQRNFTVSANSCTGYTSVSAQSVQIPAQTSAQSVRRQCNFLHRLQLSQCTVSAISCTDYSSVSAQSVHSQCNFLHILQLSQCTVSAISCRLQLARAINVWYFQQGPSSTRTVYAYCTG